MEFTLFIFNESLVCLIKKKGNTQDLKNWRPISLINADSKVVSWIMVQRLSFLNSEFLNKAQSGFLKKELIQKNVYTVDQVFKYSEYKKATGAVVFLDQEKAYDRVSHAYLFKVLKAIGIHRALYSWIYMCYRNCESRFLVNSVPGRRVSIKSGVRQGDPLSPLLYNLCFDALLESLQNELTGLLASPKVSVKVLSFADDTVVMLKNERDADILKKNIQKYENASGAKVNFEKSYTAFLGNNLFETKTQLLNDDSTITYLGFEFGKTGLNTQKTLENTYKKTKTSIQSMFSNKKLTIIGKVFVANVCILSRYRYILNVLVLDPVSQRAIYRDLREWFWNSRKPKVPFSLIKGPKKLRNLGLTDLGVMNLVAKSSYIPDIWQKETNHIWHSIAKDLETTKNKKNEKVYNEFLLFQAKNLYLKRHNFVIFSGTKNFNLINEKIKNKELYEWLFKMKNSHDLQKNKEERKYAQKILFSDLMQKKHLELLWKVRLNGQMAGNQLRMFSSDNHMCLFCEKEVDTLKHRYFYCPKIQEIWVKIIKFTSCPDIDSMHKYRDIWTTTSLKNKQLGAKEFSEQLLFTITIYTIWSQFLEQLKEEKKIDFNGMVFKILHLWLFEYKRITITKMKSTKNIGFKLRLKVFIEYINIKIRNTNSEHTSNLIKLLDDSKF